jgi:hypothetical protein
MSLPEGLNNGEKDKGPSVRGGDGLALFRRSVDTASERAPAALKGERCGRVRRPDWGSGLPPPKHKGEGGRRHGAQQYGDSFVRAVMLRREPDAGKTEAGYDNSAPMATVQETVVEPARSPFMIECPVCGYEPAEQLLVPRGPCPKCHGHCWRRALRPGSIPLPPRRGEAAPEAPSRVQPSLAVRSGGFHRGQSELAERRRRAKATAASAPSTLRSRRGIAAAADSSWTAGKGPSHA